jgi:Ser/Thr protein kinase RdoA (MazF antagonist)
LQRPAGVPAHWRAAHGDLNPWNLRRARGSRWLIDWEDAAYAPAGTDEVYFLATSAALGRGAVGALTVTMAHEEARRRWADIVGRRHIVAGEEKLHSRLCTLLGIAG